MTQDERWIVRYNEVVAFIEIKAFGLDHKTIP